MLGSNLSRGAGVMLVGVIVVLTAQSFEGRWRAASAEDEDAVKTVIENGLLLMGEACLEANANAVPTYQAALAEYWNDGVPTGSRLATREAIFDRVFPTTDAAIETAEAPERATVLVEEASTAVAEGRVTWADVTEEADEGKHPEPTPNWDPYDDPLSEMQRNVEICQELNQRDPPGGLVSYTIDEMTWGAISISGNEATVLVDLETTSEYESALVLKETYAYSFDMRRESDVWRIEGYQYYRSDGW